MLAPSENSDPKPNHIAVVGGLQASPSWSRRGDVCSSRVRRREMFCLPLWMGEATRVVSGGWEWLQEWRPTVRRDWPVRAQNARAAAEPSCSSANPPCTSGCPSLQPSQLLRRAGGRRRRRLVGAVESVTPSRCSQPVTQTGRHLNTLSLTAGTRLISSSPFSKLSFADAMHSFPGLLGPFWFSSEESLIDVLLCSWIDSADQPRANKCFNSAHTPFNM